jgi:hypothetical protein
MRYVMTEDDWKNRDKRLFASNWYSLFDNTNDNRKNLTWGGVFRGVAHKTDVTNFYSPGEDVVENPKSSSALVIRDMLSRWDTSKGAWGHQEMIKGGAGLGGLAFVRVQGGWRLWDRREVAYSSTKAELQSNPVFLPFCEGDLLGGNGSQLAADSKVRYDVLARGIPAMSFAVAPNALPREYSVDNFNMEVSGRTFYIWPSEGHGDDDRVGKWIHSDFKNVALPYVFPMYEAMISKAGLISQ